MFAPDRFRLTFHRLQQTTRKRIDLNEQIIRNKDATLIFRTKHSSKSGIGIYEGD